MMQQKIMQRLSRNSTRRTPAPAMHSIGSHGLSKLFSFVLIALLVLSVVSCRTKKTMVTQTQQMQQASSVSQDSSVSRDTARTMGQTKESLTTDQQWQQTWLIKPLDSGGYRIEGYGTAKAQAKLEGENSSCSTSVNSSSKIKRTALESNYNSVESVEEKKPPECSKGSLIKLICVWLGVALVGYLLVSYHKKY
nr:MAG TPA: hypothetical protein [Caudoviricetes sp.]